jgi:two-component system CheB/CheR fusion protein
MAKKTTKATKKRAEARADPPTERRRSAGEETENAASGARTGGASDEPLCPVVGIGASAGGFEAFEHFFGSLPPHCDLAFVLIPHLDPGGKSLMVELLSKSTDLDVCQAEQGMRVTPGHVYVVPAGALLTIRGRFLQVDRPKQTSRPHLAIDVFLRSLAVDCREEAICIILSGTGTDGTLGLKAVKEHGGMAMVQDVQTATHDGMPRSAIATGLTDYILPVEKMPEALVDYTRHMRARGRAKNRMRGEEVPAELHEILAVLRSRTGQDFRDYKQGMVIRRVERRMQLHRISRAADYLTYLHENATEVSGLFKELLIGVTHFFRDPEAFAALKARAIPHIVEQREDDTPIRIWVPGCATGEEAYSIAILLSEQMSTIGANPLVQIFATDIDEHALELARAGVYPDSIAADVSAERLERFFSHEGNTYQIKKHIRESVVFTVHNLISDPPFSKIDLISCRNVLIYLNSELQKRLLPLLCYALKPGGALFLGPSETITGLSDLFSPLDKKFKVFRSNKSGTAPTLAVPLFPLDSARQKQEEARRREVPAGTSLAKISDRMLLESYAPACVIIDENSNVIYFRGHTGRYLEAPPGAPDLNIIRMARPGLRVELRTAIQKAARERRAVRQKDVDVRTNGGTQPINLIVRPVAERSDGRGLLMVVFEDISPGHIMPDPNRGERLPASDDALVEQLEGELRESKDDLQTSVEELETSTEELRSSNEELLSTNEELQSANEELGTSKEEIQSANEELQTVNAELLTKVEELARANSDTQNLISSTQVAIVFLDGDLRIRSFTPAVSDIFKLIPTDLGRRITDFAHQIPSEDLATEIQEVLRTLSSSERYARLKGGKWYIMRILPYRSVENVVAGAVMTFTDITQIKRNEESLREAEAESRRLATVVRDSNDAITVMGLDGQILAWNRGAERMYGYTEAEALEMNTRELIPEDHQAETFVLSQSISRAEEIPSFQTQRICKDGRRLAVSVTLTLLRDEKGSDWGIATTERDVTQSLEQVRALSQQLQDRNSELERTNKELEDFAQIASHDLKEPLRGIHNFSAFLLEDHADQLDNEGRRKLGTIIRLTRKMQTLIESLLHLAHAGRAGVSLGPISLQALVEEVVDSLYISLEEHGVEVRIPKPLPTIHCDRVRVAEVFRNLISNAMRYNDKSEKWIEIGYDEGDSGPETANKRASTVLYVRDNGIGIPPEELGSIFRIFRRLHPPDDYGGGTGAGLAIAKKIVEGHGGRIWVDSTPGEGTTFYFTIERAGDVTALFDHSGGRGQS